MNNNKKEAIIYLDQEGYDRLLANIKELKEKLNENNRRRIAAFNASIGNGTDYLEFEEIEGVASMITRQLKNAYDELSRVVIVEKTENSDIVNIGDVVKLYMKLYEDKCEDVLFKLVGGAPKIDFDAEISEISVDSPIGNAIYQKKVGEKCTYLVNDEQFEVLIMEIIHLEKQKEGQKKIKKNNKLV